MSDGVVCLWQALDRSDARGLIQGYEVSYAPSKHLAHRRTNRTSDLKMLVSVMSEEYDVTVSAYNSAGRSPSRRLRVNAALHHGEKTHGLSVLSDSVFHKSQTFHSNQTVVYLSRCSCSERSLGFFWWSLTDVTLGSWYDCSKCEWVCHWMEIIFRCVLQRMDASERLHIYCTSARSSL